jgi:uncharacterized protein
MTPKTERFEMRLDPALFERVDGWRSQQGDTPSRAEAIRRLIETGLSSQSPRGFHPNGSEKLMIWLLTEVLKGQKGYDNKEQMELIQEAIYGGHLWALDWEMKGIFHSHTDEPEAVNLVVDVLDMWNFVENAYAAFSTAEKKRIETEVGIHGKDPKFFGFDGNHETEYMSIARFLVEKMERFEFLKGRGFNSHSRTVGRYKRMAEKFESMRASLVGRGLTADQVIDLLKAL